MKVLEIRSTSFNVLANVFMLGRYMLKDQSDEQS